MALTLVLFNFEHASYAKTSQINSFRGGGSGKISISVPYSYEFLKFVINDDKLFTQLIPGMTRWQVIDSTQNSQTAICTMSTSKLIPPVTYTAKVDRISDHEIQFKRIRGDLKSLQGNWSIHTTQDPNNSIINYSYSFDTGLGFIPGNVAAGEIEKHLNATEKRVKAILPKLFKANSSRFEQKVASSKP
ncbi:MAG: SRPBCC family protein [Candidatus Caenarcaniphilales bacterium]|nr:SRPBCC family protein [Candidatus Caenarcaniphilales bacterium]